MRLRAFSRILVAGTLLILLGSVLSTRRPSEGAALLFPDCLLLRSSHGAIVDHATAFDVDATWRRIVGSQVRDCGKGHDGPSWVLGIPPGEVSSLLGNAMRAAAEVAPGQRVITHLSYDPDTGVSVYRPSRHFRAWDQKMVILPGAGNNAILIGWDDSREIQRSEDMERFGLRCFYSMGYMLVPREGIADSRIVGPHLVLDVAPGVDARALIVTGQRLCDRLGTDAIAVTVRAGDRADALSDSLQWPHLLAQAEQWGVGGGDELVGIRDLLSAVCTPVVTSQAMADRLAEVYERVSEPEKAVTVEDVSTSDLIELCSLIECWRGRYRDSGSGDQEALTESLRRIVIPLSRALAERYAAQEGTPNCTQKAAWLLCLVVSAGFSEVQLGLSEEEWAAIEAVSLAVDQELGIDAFDEAAFPIEVGRSLEKYWNANPPSTSDERLVRFLPAFRRAACADGALGLAELAVLHSRLRWGSLLMPDEDLREILRAELIPLARVTGRVDSIEQLLLGTERRDWMSALELADVVVLGYWLGQAGGI